MVRYFAPASSGNLSVGFDNLGAAFYPVDGSMLGDELIIHGEAPVVTLHVSGRYAHQLPPEPQHNLVLTCFYAFAERVALPPLEMTLVKHLPVGSGLGSSACSIVVTLYALNDYCGQPLTVLELLELAARCEGGVSGSVHYDNVAPSLLGGLQLMLPGHAAICRRLPWFDSWYVVLSYPGTTLSTKAARAVLPKVLPLPDAIHASGLLARFVSALYCQDAIDALAAMQDHIAEPSRVALMPQLPTLRQALLALGAGHVGISGAGPTIFAICPNMTIATAVAAYLRTHYEKNSDGMTHICQLAAQGAVQLTAPAIEPAI